MELIWRKDNLSSLRKTNCSRYLPTLTAERAEVFSDGGFVLPSIESQAIGFLTITLNQPKEGYWTSKLYYIPDSITLH
jgi:hypothetical protein